MSTAKKVLAFSTMCVGFFIAFLDMLIFAEN
jgi:hypothetical protein